MRKTIGTLFLALSLSALAEDKGAVFSVDFDAEKINEFSVGFGGWSSDNGSLNRFFFSKSDWGREELESNELYKLGFDSTSFFGRNLIDTSVYAYSDFEKALTGYEASELGLGFSLGKGLPFLEKFKAEVEFDFRPQPFSTDWQDDHLLEFDTELGVKYLINKNFIAGAKVKAESLVHSEKGFSATPNGLNIHLQYQIY